MQKILYDSLKESDFFTFFNMSEKDTINLDDSKIKKLLQPGGFREFIYIEITVNNKDEIISAILELNRDWVGNSKNLNVFSQDIAKSFIQAMAPNHIKNQLNDFTDKFFRIHGTNDNVMSILPEVKISDVQGDFQEFLLVFIGEANKSKIDINDASFSIENFNEEGKIIVSIQFSTK